MEKVRSWCGQPSDRGRLNNRNRWVGLGPNFSTCSGLGWVGSHEMDPWTTLLHRPILDRVSANDLSFISPIGNESVPKITINKTINLFYKTAISILVISNHDIFRMLFDKIASVYIF